MTDRDIKERLKSIKYPGFTRDIVSFGLIKEIRLEEDRCEVRLSMATDDSGIIAEIVAAVESLLGGIEELPPVDVVVEKPRSDPAARARDAAAAMGKGPKGVPGVTRTVAVASGKGGVGKSTVAANLAVSLARLGFRVGLLDTDIYGPSVPTMFGVTATDGARGDEEGRLVPFERHGVKLVSMGFFVGPGAPLIWRGPMLNKALGQFLSDVVWGELDYLVLDLPPGTGDVQMTLTQSLTIDGGIIVTTPQDVALADVERGVKMFEQAGTPVLGVMENMSYHVCSGCGEKTHIFGDGGGMRVSNRFNVPFLGGVPLVREVREGGDSGTPVTVGDPDGEAGEAFLALAKRVSTEISVQEVGHA